MSNLTDNNHGLCPGLDGVLVTGPIMDCFKEKGLSYEEVEMILVGNHAPFTWGKMQIKEYTTARC